MNLTEAAQWEDGIYQLEESDPVMGGPDGIDNVQAKQLANRTRYLKAQVEQAQSGAIAHVGAADPHPQYAQKASPTFTGVPKVPTPAAGDNSQQAANTAWVAAAIASLVNSAPGALDTLRELADALGGDPSFAATMTNALAQKAPLASPELTGTPKTPTAPGGDSSKQVANAEFVQQAIGAGSIAFFARSTAPAGYLKANGATVSRTTYTALFTAIGTTFGAGDGAATFNLPDLRGEFPRGWDDGRGVDKNRAFGSAQLDALQDHAHAYIRPLITTDTDRGSASSLYSIDDHETGVTGSVATGAGYRTATETRPRNVALLACIKY